MPLVSSIIDLSLALEGIRAVVNRDIDKIDLGLLSIGPYRAGSVVTLPPQIMEVLMRRGVVTLPDELRITPEEIQKRLWLESRSHGELRPLPKEFYVRARLSLTDKAALSQLRELIHLRLRKIMIQVSMNPPLAESREFMEKLTLEEEALVKSMVVQIKEFMEYVVGR